MPEIFEAGYFFPIYIWFFIFIVTIVYGPNGLHVIGLWCDLSAGESKAAATREATLLDYAKTLDKRALARGHLGRWARDLQDLADAIPDTHGLMIHTVGFGEGSMPQSDAKYPPIMLRGIPFALLCKIWSMVLVQYQHRVHIPYQIGNTPSQSGLVVKITRHMPEIFRGRDPDPSRQKKRGKARSISPNNYVSDSEDEDMDTTIALDPEIPTEDDEKEDINCYRESHSTETDFSRYFWPRYALPVLSETAYSAVEAMQLAGMKLKGLVYDARKTIMDLGTIEPLLHTSPQFYTRKQWNGVLQVPNGHRGFKIGYAIEFLSHILCWNSFDNNFRLHWRTPDEELENYQASHVPDPIFDYSSWCSYTVEWLRQVQASRKGLKQLTLLEAFTAPGRQPFRGLGRYGANEVLSIAGIPGWMLFSVIIADKVLFAVICEAFFQFVSVRALKAEEYYHNSRTTTAERLDDEDVDHSINVTLSQQLQLQSFVTKFGHLGSLIAGEYWDTILCELLQSQRTLSQLEDEYLGLPAILSPSELLHLKPQFLLNSQDCTALVALYGWSENPIAKYFSQDRYSKPCSRIDQSKLSLTSERKLWRDTYLVRIQKRSGFIRNTQKKKDSKFDPLYSLESEAFKSEYTIKYIKENTKGWTVDLSASQMLAMQASWDARSRYPAGMRKMAAEKIKAEKTWRSKVKSSIVKELGGDAASASPDLFSREIRLRRKQERDELKKKIRSLMSDDGKPRLFGPKDSGRVKNRSQISSLGRKWIDIAMNPM
ncbi:hypothetical protein C8R44DRAFT_752552 [Mycena epipterygia]|nr:hypothetical protein C8R44DRAFT_752552 [Mycena epipterygia]